MMNNLEKLSEKFKRTTCASSIYQLIRNHQSVMASVYRIASLTLLLVGLASTSLILPHTINIEPGTYPFLVSVQVFNHRSLKYRHLCAGAIISDKWIVSAANCFQIQRLQPSELVVVFGADVLERDGDAFPVKQLINHPIYNRNESRTLADLALIETLEKMKFDEKVQPIPLSAEEIDGVGASVFATSWIMVRRLENNRKFKR